MLHDARADSLASKLVTHASSYGFHAWKDGAYAKWKLALIGRLLEVRRRLIEADLGDGIATAYWPKE